MWRVINDGDDIIVFFWDDDDDDDGGVGGGWVRGAAFVLMLTASRMCMLNIQTVQTRHCLVTHYEGGKSLSISKGELTVTINEHVKYFYSSGVQKYPCEFWPALLLFCMMLCFEKNAS